MKDLLIKAYTDRTNIDFSAWDYQFPYTFPINWLNPWVPILAQTARVNDKTFAVAVNAPKH